MTSPRRFGDDVFGELSRSRLVKNLKRVVLDLKFVDSGLGRALDLCADPKELYLCSSVVVRTRGEC